MALVEVLVAVVILFAGMTAILRVYSGAVAALDAADVTLGALLAAQEEMETVALVSRSDAHPFDPANRLAVVVPGYTSRMTMQPAAREEALPLATCRIAAARRGEGDSVVVTLNVVRLP